MPDVEFAANGGTASGYLAEPEEAGPGLIVLQEWWGVDEHIRDVCDRFAAEGFVALAPDLFHGETTDQPDEAQQKMMAMNMDEAEKEMRGAVDYVLEHPKCNGNVGSVGFCLGGGLSVWAATANE
jgi:carboxymethylenebutenolidase